MFAEHIDPNVDNWQPVAMVRGMLWSYDQRWRSAQSEIETLEIERTYTAPLYNLETQRTSRTFTLASKIDKLVEHAGNCIIDHKTTSDDISDPDATYWRQLVIEGQPSHYQLLCQLNGIKIDRVVWDVVRKPGIRPKMLPKKELAEIVSLGTYCGFQVTQHAQEEAAREQRENAELYEYRVCQEMTGNPDRYFARRSATRANSELAEYADELWQITQEIRQARVSGHWYRNSGACMQYGTPCEYLGICSGHDTPESDRWMRKEQVHDELELDGDGKDVITNSRLRCFQSCRRKHLYRYEMGLRRVDEEQRETLFVGSLWGQAMDWWWGQFQAMDAA